MEAVADAFAGAHDLRPFFRAPRSPLPEGEGTDWGRPRHLSEHITVFRLIEYGIGHNSPQESPGAFAKTVSDGIKCRRPCTIPLLRFKSGTR